MNERKKIAGLLVVSFLELFDLQYSLRKDELKRYNTYICIFVLLFDMELLSTLEKRSSCFVFFSFRYVYIVFFVVRSKSIMK